MTETSPTTHSLRRVFRESIVARDLAEPLVSFDDSVELDTLREFMVQRPLSVLGIRRGGVIVGYLRQELLDLRPLAEQMQPIAEATIVTTTSPVQQVVALLDSLPFVLVSTLGQPVGVIMREDLEKPPMRMWLFGMITLFEMTITRLLKQAYPGDSWQPALSPARVVKARQLQTERARRHQRVELLDCLQLSDKGQVFAKSDGLRERFWKRSRTEIRGVVKQLEGLRNNLAHSQPFIADNWDALIRLSAALDALLEIPAEYLAVDSLPSSTEGDTE